MAGINNPNALKTKGRLSPKEVIIKTAALTLLLSTIACSIGGIDSSELIPCGILSVFLAVVAFDCIEHIQDSIKKQEKERYEKLHPAPKDPAQERWDNTGPYHY